MMPLRSSFRRFRSDRRGNVATMFAFGAVPLILMVGVGVDYTYSATMRSKLNALADAAALEAVSKTAVGGINSQSNTDNGEANAKKFFDEQAKLVAGATITKSEVKVTRSITTLSATVTYTGYVPNSFGGLIGAQTTAIGGSATSTTSLPLYQDFYLFLDNSPSMGLGATQADIDNLKAATKNNTSMGGGNTNCGFACHVVGYANDFYTVARSKGITLRIDEVRTATQALMDNAKATESYDNQFRVAIYTFNDKLVEVTKLTDDLDKAKTSASVVDLTYLPSFSYNNYRLTDYDGLFPTMATKIAASGSGAFGSPQSVMFIVTDGVADEPDPKNPGNYNGRVWRPLTTALCDAIKSKGVSIAVLYTTYLPLPDNGTYNSNVKPFAANIAPRMQACASPGLYFEVNTDGNISAAMQALFQKAVYTARLTK